MSRAKRFLKWGGIGLLGLFILVTAVGFLLPSRVEVTRSVTTSAPPETIYPLIANLEKGWPEWSPWEQERDADAQFEYSGPSEGVGATQVFQDNGEGRLTITKADPSTGIEYDLVLMNESFRLKGSLLCSPKDDGRTEVVFKDEIDYGANPYWRYFGLIIEGPLGDQLAEGLANLKTKAEARADAALTAQKSE